MKIISVVGARPNFMKIAPFTKAIADYNQKNPQEKVEHILVHTGQHYDIRMSDAFFTELNIPAPDINLEIGSGSHAEQVGHTMIAFEKVLVEHIPDWVVIVGDVNATLSCSVTAKKMNIRVCHIESGLRSGDMTMPEEINRLVADRLSDLLLTPDKISSRNLVKEGVSENKIKFVGNIMIDTLEANRSKANLLEFDDIISRNLINANPGISINEPVLSYSSKAGTEIILPVICPIVLMTLHRPSNVDNVEVLTPLIHFLINEVAMQYPIVWPIHPRTLKQLQKFKLLEKVNNCKNFMLLEPVGYVEMLRLNTGARMMFTDSGGLQEECCVLGTPCLTLRWNTERPITLREHGGASVLVGNNVENIKAEYYNTLQLNIKPFIPELWDGHAAERCLEAILRMS